MNTIDNLQKIYPIPEGWQIPEIVIQQTEVGSERINVVGIAAHNNIAGATGSAADSKISPTDRAYFELLERISIIEGIANSSAEFPFYVGNSEKKISSKELFLNSNSNQWVFSKSNGIALGKTFNEAAQRAKLELIERDRILKHWYFQRRPKPATKTQKALQNLSDLYDFRYCEFTPDKEEKETDVHVVGVFGFPKNENKPYVYGLAAATEKETAFIKAERELKQGLGFLWDEEISHALPEFNASPMYHQEYYSTKKRSKTIQRWIDGENKPQSPIFSIQNFSLSGFADITPDFLKGKLYVVKAIDMSRLPLVFGNTQEVIEGVDRDFLIHPIS